MGNERIPYPKSVFFIIINEFCERFSYYGMKAVLTIYLKNVLMYPENQATVIYHVFSMFCYFTCIFGAMIADSFLGKFRTIFYLSLVYAAGNVLLSLAATTDVGLPPREFSMTGLALIAIGTGGIKPCVAAFGGDQFKLPEQERQLTTFFSIFYFSINAGSLISTFITPIFRKDIHCFNQDTCYPLAFGVPAILMITALVIFLCGKPFYRIIPPEGNVVMKVFKCIAHALKRKSSSGDKREHWLDYAEGKYSRDLIEDIKVILRVLFLYLPLPIFWALFDQQGSRWTFQATRMDGEVFGLTIKPDQMQVVNPFLILALIPLFDQVIYPGLGKFNLLKKPLQRLTLGGCLAAVAFIVSGILELKLEPTYAIQLQGEETNLNFVNTLPCSIGLSIPNVDEITIAKYENHIFSQIDAKNYDVKIVPDSNNTLCSGMKSHTYVLQAVHREAFTYIIGAEGSSKSIQVFRTKDADDLEKSHSEGKPRVRLIHTGLLESNQWNEENNVTIVLKAVDNDKVNCTLKVESNETKPIDIEAAKYDAKLQNGATGQIVELGTFHFRLGGVYVMTLTKNFATPNDFVGNSSYVANSYAITEPNSVHMLWLLPQYIIITVAEVMFSITGLEFSYNQAPLSMKSVMQSAWLLTVAFGNLIVVIIAEAHLFDKQSKEFFLFAGLMTVDMMIFAVMAYFYKPAPTNNNNTEFGDEMVDKPAKVNEGYHEE